MMPVKLPNGRHTLATVTDGSIKYHAKSWGAKQGAVRAMRAMTPHSSAPMSHLELKKARRLVTLTSKIDNAISDIVLHGSTWRAASDRWGVSQSGILRAIRRMREAIGEGNGHA